MERISQVIRDSLARCAFTCNVRFESLDVLVRAYYERYSDARSAITETSEYRVGGSMVSWFPGAKLLLYNDSFDLKRGSWIINEIALCFVFVIIAIGIITCNGYGNVNFGEILVFDDSKSRLFIG